MPQSEPPILLLVGSSADSKITKLEKELSDDGYDVTLVSMPDDDESYVNLKKALVDNMYRLVFISPELRADPVKYERLKGRLEDTSSGKAVMVEPTDSEDAAEKVREAIPQAQQL